MVRGVHETPRRAGSPPASLAADRAAFNKLVLKYEQSSTTLKGHVRARPALGQAFGAAL